MKSFTKSLLIFLIICHLLRKQSIESKTRRFYHTKEELELTKADPIIDNKPCSGHTLAVFIHSAGRSSGKYFERRQFVRNSWVKELKEYEIDIYFTIALNKNQTINEELREESDTYKDMIQFPFIDAFYILTLKAKAKCLSAKYILKSDDDGFINSALLIDKLSQFERGISGFLEPYGVVGRNISSIFTNNWKDIFY